MNWILWLVLLGWSAIPITLLVADRVIDLDSHRFLRFWGLPLLAASAALLIAVGATRPDYLELVAWGALVGLFGTVTLDVVRLIGLRFGTFPLDMPVVFGAMATGRIKAFQHLVMGRVLRGQIATGAIKEFVAERIGRLPDLSVRQRVNVASTMMGAIATLSEEEGRQVAEAQFEALSGLADTDRRLVMQAMDSAGAGARAGQPRGLPRISMRVFQPAAADAVVESRERDRVGFGWSLVVGYVWHAVNGVTFGIMYALIFGQGSWLWALVWGVAVWLAMMISMPLMMPTLGLPAWFPVVPLIAHFAMVAPFIWLTSWVSDSSDLVSLLGWLDW